MAMKKKKSANPRLLNFDLKRSWLRKSRCRRNRTTLTITEHDVPGQKISLIWQHIYYSSVFCPTLRLVPCLTVLWRN